MNPTPLARILIVDDEAAQMCALCDTLRDQGYETAGYSTGEEALKALQEKPFDVLLTDLMMPGMDGVALLAAALKIDSQLVGILMTGMGTIETAVQAMQAGALDYILKPFKVSAILPVLARALSVRRLRQENLELKNTVAIHELNQALAYTRDPNVLLDKIVDAALQQFEADEASIMLLAKDGRSFQVAAVRGEGREALLGTRVPISEGIAGWVAARREPLVLEGEVRDPSIAPRHPRAEIQSALSMPMVTCDRLIGVININCIRKPRAFTLGRIKVLCIFTNAAAAGIEAARLYGELRESEELFHSAMQYSTIGMALVAPDGRWLEVNDAVCAMLGYSRDELLATNFQALTHPDDLDADLEQVRAMLERRITSYQMEKRYLHKTGRIVWVLLGVSLVHHTDGRARNFISQIHDITERKRAVEEIAHQHAFLRNVIDLDSSFIFAKDRAGRFTLANQAVAEAYGVTVDELIGKCDRDFNPNPEEVEQFRRDDLDVLDGLKDKFIAEEKITDAAGKVRWLQTVKRPIFGDHGRADMVLGVATDITERKRAEEDILDLNASLERRVAERTQQLDEANRAKSDFLANMSHELRTPLNAIIGFAELLKDGVVGKLEAKQQRFVGDIFGAGTHLLSLINDILDLSKVEAGMLQLEADAVDVPALLQASTTIVREKALAHRIGLDTRLDPGLGAMLADERKLKQIVYNLLSNAIKFTPEGGTVTLSAHRCARAEVAFDEAMPARLLPLAPGEDGEFLAISVEDSGVGIAEEDLQKLYQPFTQVDSSVSRSHAGTGLGLSLVRRLAELHGGTVGVASRPGTGSRFCVWLPYREAAAAQEDRAATEAAASSTSGAAVPFAPAGAAPTRPAPPLALVIEDDDQVADLIAARLHVEGFQVMRAATGEEGLVRAAKRRPQLITLDIFLPAMDGWEFLRHLKADPRLADTPVVIISVSEDMERGLALGARRVLQKPFTGEELVSALAGLIEAPRSEGAPARVLVVDDNVKAVELVAALVEREGYQASRAYGGAEAIRAARAARPDLVILDLMMPEVSGFEVARALRASEHTARIPILVLTAKDLTPEERAQLNGAVGAILQKSEFSHDELLAELRRAIVAPKPD